MSATEEGFTVRSKSGTVITAMPPAPGAKPYWRLDLLFNGERKQPSGGRTVESAKAAAAEWLRRLDEDAQDETLEPIRVLLDAYLADKRRTWASGTAKQNARYLNLYLAKFEQRRCEELDRKLFRAVLAQAPTSYVGAKLHLLLGGLLNWGQKQDYIVARQLDAHAAVNWTAPKGYVEQRPKRHKDSRAKQSEESAHRIDLNQVPDFPAVKALAAALGARYVRPDADGAPQALGALMVQLNAFCGMRMGETLALTAACVTDDDWLLIDWKVEESGGPKHLTLPKGGKTRRTRVPENKKVATKFPLRTEFARRVVAARAEQAAGSNPRALLFPAPQGGWWSQSNLRRRLLVPAYEAAGWPSTQWVDHQGNERLDYTHTWHSLRDRFAVTGVNEWKLPLNVLTTLGGWEDEGVIFARYYGKTSAVELTAAKLLG